MKQTSDDRHEPLVSVIMPTYKRKPELVERAMNSLITQSYANIEIVVVDDSPGDYQYRAIVKALLDKLASRDSRIYYYQNASNQGGALARNKGIDLANGEFITFLDDDDEYLPEKIEHQVTFMLEHKCDLSFSNMIMYDDSGKIVDRRSYFDISHFTQMELFKYHLMYHFTGTPTFMFKADKLREIGGFKDVKMGQEFYLMVRAIKGNLNISYMDVCDVKIHKHNELAISNGPGKIKGEMDLYRFKLQYFDLFSKQEKRYINFRHQVVLAVAFKRNQQYFNMIKKCFKCLFCYPDLTINESLNFLGKIK